MKFPQLHSSMLSDAVLATMRDEVRDQVDALKGRGELPENCPRLRDLMLTLADLRAVLSRRS